MTQTKLICMLFLLQANVVFDKILAKKNYNGPVLFLEDDHYVAPDFIPTLRMMNQLRTRSVK